jgi:hypothetical protein
VAADRISAGQEYIGEIYYVKHNEHQKWYYLSLQSPEELSVFVSFDSERDFGPACKLSAYVTPWMLNLICPSYSTCLVHRSYS